MLFPVVPTSLICLQILTSNCRHCYTGESEKVTEEWLTVLNQNMRSVTISEVSQRATALNSLISGYVLKVWPVSYQPQRISYIQMHCAVETDDRKTQQTLQKFLKKCSPAACQTSERPGVFLGCACWCMERTRGTGILISRTDSVSLKTWTKLWLDSWLH